MNPYAKALALISAANFSILILVLAGGLLAKKFAYISLFGLSFEWVIWFISCLSAVYILLSTLIALKRIKFKD